jgi:hypothetical protein
MLIRKKKTKKNQTPRTDQMVYDPNLGSGWVPGVSDGSWLLPDSARQPLEDIVTDGFHHWVPRCRGD